MEQTITIRGTVQPGRRLGRTLGFPTANVHPTEEDGRAAAGVWLARVTVEESGRRYWALVNVGRRPTVEPDAGPNGEAIPQPQCKAEAWLFDFDGDLYGREIVIELMRYLRPERRFGSLEELRAAIEQDKRQAINIIRNDDEYTL